jgi:outer membrane protein
MKKQILTLLAVVSLGFAAQAQSFVQVEEVQYQSVGEKPSYGFSEGNIFVEGNLSVGTSKDNNTDVKTTNVEFTPQVGYFFSDKFAAGVYFALNNEKIKSPGSTVKSDAFGVGIFGRYYFLEAGQRFKFYAQANAGYAHVKANGAKGDGFNVGADLGVNYFVTKKIAVNFAFANIVGYTSTKAKGAKAENEFNLNLNKFNNPFDTPTFGLTFVF